MKSVLSVAGSDSSGGAGIQADIKTIQSMHVFAQTALTALTAQNTLGVSSVLEVASRFVEDQIDAVFADIRPDAVKIGMVSSASVAECVACALQRNGATNVVVDPVMVATSGARLISEDALGVLTTELFALASVITPNIPEAEILSGRPIEGKADQEDVARVLADRFGCAVLVKGGHGLNDANDVLAQPACPARWFEALRIDNPNTHGTGCTLSSAIACGLALGHSLEDSVSAAKQYLSGALAAGLDLGKGPGPLDHMWNNRLIG